MTRISLTGVMLAALPGLGSAGCQADGRGFQSILSNRPSEQWTIFCREFKGPHAQQHCAQFARTLRRTPGIRADQVRCEHVPGNQVSRLYYGKYTRSHDPRTNALSMPPQLEQDLNFIQTLGDHNQRSFFLGAYTMPVVAPYEGPPEWNLVNAPGLYTLEIAVFYPEGSFTESRKAAVQLAKELRDQGHEAYYYHGLTQSSVTVGTFGENAVVVLPDGRRRHSAAVEALRRRDPRFAHHYENGQVRIQIKNGKRIKPASQLVGIPEHNAGG